MSCYCNSNKEYNACCGPIHKGTQTALTAEELMRSRYSAFVTADINYLMKSHHASTRPIKEKQDILVWTKSVQWLGLQIISKSTGLTSDMEGRVEFKATFVENGKPHCIHENSYFVKEKGEWFYKSGIHR